MHKGKENPRLAYQILRRHLKERHIQLIAFGGIIGSSYFLGTGYIINQVGPATFLAYIFGGLLTYLTLSCFAELATGLKGAGSFVNYSATFISPSWACGVGWSYWLNWVVYVPSECLAGGIVMYHFIPEVPIYLWAFLFGLVVTLANIINVGFFGELEFWLAMVKVFAMVLFAVLASLIFFGIIGTVREPIGNRYFLQDGGLFPRGVMILFVNMVVLLTNFMGSEIIGLTASEAKDHKKVIPASLKKLIYRLFALYLLPTLLITVIFPWQKAGLSDSVFATALGEYGFPRIAYFFNFVVIAAALSCCNSGLYASVRSLYSLSLKGMAPARFSKLNRYGSPSAAVWTTIFGIWITLTLTYFLAPHTLYANLLALSGFTGAITWISICWAQLRFRRSLEAKGEKPPCYKVPWFPFTSHLGIWLQVGCLLIVAVSSQLRPTFYFGIPAVLLPILIYKFYKRRTKFGF